MASNRVGGWETFGLFFPSESRTSVCIVWRKRGVLEHSELFGTLGRTFWDWIGYPDVGLVSCLVCVPLYIHSAAIKPNESCTKSGYVSLSSLADVVSQLSAMRDNFFSVGALDL